MNEARKTRAGRAALHCTAVKRQKAKPLPKKGVSLVGGLERKKKKKKKKERRRSVIGKEEGRTGSCQIGIGQ